MSSFSNDLAPWAGLDPNARHNSALTHYAGLSGAVILSVETIHNRPLYPYVNQVRISHSLVPVLPRYDHHWLSGDHLTPPRHQEPSTRILMELP